MVLEFVPGKSLAEVSNQQKQQLRDGMIWLPGSVAFFLRGMSVKQWFVVLTFSNQFNRTWVTHSKLACVVQRSYVSVKDKTHSNKSWFLGKWWKNLSSPWGSFPWLFGISEMSLQPLLPQNSPQMMEVEKVIGLFPCASCRKSNSKKQKFPSLSFTQKKKTVAPVATPHKHHKQVGCSLSGRSSRAPEVSTAHGVLVKLKERPGAEKSLWAIEMEFNEAAFEWSFFVLFGRFVLEVQGLLNAWIMGLYYTNQRVVAV